jgi:hypothetical protein
VPTALLRPSLTLLVELIFEAVNAVFQLLY